MGQNIKFLRKNYGLSQRELAERLGLKRNNIASYEAGIVEPRAITFVAIARFFEVDPVILLSKLLSNNSSTLAPPSESPTGPGAVAGSVLPGDERKVRDLIEELRKFYRGHSPSGTDNNGHSNQEVETMLTTLTDLLSQPE